MLCLRTLKTPTYTVDVLGCSSSWHWAPIGFHAWIMRNSENWQKTPQHLCKGLSAGTAAWQAAPLWCRRAAQLEHGPRSHNFGVTCNENQVLRLQWQCWLSAQKWAPAQSLDELQRKLLTGSSSKKKISKFLIHANLKFLETWQRKRSGRERKFSCHLHTDF